MSRFFKKRAIHPVLEQKKLWFGVFAALAGGYWFLFVYPFFWISEAHLKMHTVCVRSEANGKMKSLFFQEGDAVRQGGVLAVLENGAFAGREKQAQAVVDANRVQLRIAKQRLDQAMQEYLTLRTDVELGKIPKESTDQQLTFLQEAQSYHDLAGCRLSSAEAKGSILAAQTGKTSIAAPFDGVILRREGQEGEGVRAGDLLYEVADPRQMWLEAFLPENSLRKVSLGNPARIHFSAYPGQEWKGRVVSIGAAVVSSRGVPLKISLEEGPEEIVLKSGLNAEVGIKIH